MTRSVAEVEELEGDLVRSSSAKLNAGELESARAELLRYLGSTDRRPVKLLANLLFSFIGRNDVPAKTVRAYCDAALVVLETDRLAFHTTPFVVNLSRVLNDHGRYAESIEACAKAIASRYFSADCYINMTYAAIQTREPAVMRSAVARIDKIIETSPKNIANKLGSVVGVFDNAAVLHVLLGNKAQALRYVALCKEHGYEGFDKMPADPDYASIAKDPGFVRLFRA